MKKYYKVVSLALAGAITAGSFTPISSHAEEINGSDGQQIEEAQAVQEGQEESPEVIQNQVQDQVQEQTQDAQGDASDLPDTEAGDSQTQSEPADASEQDAEATDALNQELELTEEEKLLKEQEEERLRKEQEEKEKAELERLRNEMELKEPKDDEDFNEDGISDLMTKRLCDGEILTKDGAKAFGSLSYEEVQSKNDLDSDGLLNGSELSVVSEEGSEYVVLKSDPCKLDTDSDGINDADDTAPWERGLEGGVLGSVRLIARHDESTGNPTHGHVYIVYTSYVDNLEISIENLYGYYVANPMYKAQLDAACQRENGEVVSWRSTVDEITEANEAERNEAAMALYQEQNHEKHTPGSVVLNRGDYISIGNYGMASINETVQNVYLPEAQKVFAHNDAELAKLWNEATGQNVDEEYVRQHAQEIIESLKNDSSIYVDYLANNTTDGGVWINRELFNQKYAYDQGPNQVIERDATQQELNVMLDAFSNNSYFNIFTHNCSTVGTEAWNQAYGYEKDEKGQVKTDENGQAVKSAYYVNAGVQTGVGRFDFPLIVKNSIKSMKNLPGYIGEMVYVTGKSVVNTVNNAVKSFDISKLFTKKSAANASGAATHTNSSSNADNDSSESTISYNKSYSAPAVVTSSSIKKEAVSLEEDTVVAANNGDTKPSRTKAAKKSNKKADGVKTVDIKDSDLDEEEIKQDSKVATKETTIEEEETPLVGEESNSRNGLWVVLVVIVAIAGAITGVAVKKKKTY